MAQLNETVPDTPCPSPARTVGLYVPALVGLPVIRPLALILRPGGSPVAEKDSFCPFTGSAGETCRLTAVPVTPDWWPGSSRDIRPGLSWSRSTFPWIPLTLPLLVYCQNAQLVQPAGSVGLDPEL